MAKVTASFEYRIMWQHKGSKYHKTVLAQKPLRVLKLLNRVAGPRPWEGATRTNLRKAWARLSLALNAPWESVADLPLREVLQRLKDLYGEIDWLRVEWRQVGQWTEMVDPATNLRTPNTTVYETRHAKLVESIEAMSREELDNWRFLPPNVKGDVRPFIERFDDAHSRTNPSRRLGGQKRWVKRAGTAAPASGDTDKTGQP